MISISHLLAHRCNRERTLREVMSVWRASPRQKTAFLLLSFRTAADSRNDGHCLFLAKTNKSWVVSIVLGHLGGVRMWVAWKGVYVRFLVSLWYFSKSIECRVLPGVVKLVARLSVLVYKKRFTHFGLIQVRLSYRSSAGLECLFFLCIFS